MMTMVMMFISIMSMMMFLTTMNPVKMMTILLLTSGVMILFMNLMLGNSWFPLILYLLFTGGILIIFMIMASLLPNEKFMKMSKGKSMMIFLMTSSLIFSQVLIKSPTSTSKTKWSSESSLSMSLTMYIILIYFFSFLSLIQSSKNPLRSNFCL